MPTAEDRVPEKFVLLNHLADEIGIDRTSARRLARQAGLVVRKVYAAESGNQAASAVTAGDVKRLLEFLAMRGHRAGTVVSRDDLRGMVEEWRKP